MTTKPIPIERWGKDHWSTFGYIETRIVDHKGVPSLAQMRCDPDIHPQFGCHADVGTESDPDKRFPTRLNDGELTRHDDWSCLDDAEAVGFLENTGTGMHRVYRFTDEGLEVAQKLRAHKAEGGQFAEFSYG